MVELPPDVFYSDTVVIENTHTSLCSFNGADHLSIFVALLSKHPSQALVHYF
jgi:hypothetical protein